MDYPWRKRQAPPKSGCVVRVILGREVVELATLHNTPQVSYGIVDAHQNEAKEV